MQLRVLVIHIFHGDLSRDGRRHILLLFVVEGHEAGICNALAVHGHRDGGGADQDITPRHLAGVGPEGGAAFLQGNDLDKQPFPLV